MWLGKPVFTFILPSVYYQTINVYIKVLGSNCGQANLGLLLLM